MWQSLATADIIGSLAGAIYLATAIRPQMQKDSLSNPLVLEEGRYLICDFTCHRESAASCYILLYKTVKYCMLLGKV